MADDAAVLDAPVLETPIEEVETPVVEEAAAEVAEPIEVKGDERVMPQWIKNLKATDPLGFKAAKADFFGKRALDEKLKDFDLDGTKAFLEEHGGRESLATALTDLQTKAAELDSINQAIAEGKTEILDSIPAESLSKLAPAVAQKWAEADPEGWGKAMSSIMAATIQRCGVPMFLERIGMFLEFGKTEEAKQAITQLGEWAGSFQKQASAPVTPKQPPASRLDDREQNIVKEEQRIFTSALTQEVETGRAQQIEKSLEPFLSRRPKDADAKELAIGNVRQQVIQRLSQDQAFQKSLNALVARKDKDGAMRLIKSRETAAIQEIAPKVGRTIFGNPAAIQEKKPVTESKAEAGFSLTDKPPRPELIDRRFTSDAMIMRGKFILKDGSKLTLEA